jgi:hypothetical protein
LITSDAGRVGGKPAMFARPCAPGDKAATS